MIVELLILILITIQFVNQSIKVYFLQQPIGFSKQKRLLTEPPLQMKQKGRLDYRVRSQTGTRQSISVHGKHIQGKRVYICNEMKCQVKCVQKGREESSATDVSLSILLLQLLMKLTIFTFCPLASREIGILYLYIHIVGMLYNLGSHPLLK